MSYNAISHGGVARTSTLIVDSDIDMQGNDILGVYRCAIRQIHASQSEAIICMKPFYIDNNLFIAQSIIPSGQPLIPAYKLATYVARGIEASDTVRYTDDTIYNITETAWKPIAKFTLPARYQNGGTLNISTNVGIYGGAGMKVATDIYVDGISTGNVHNTIGTVAGVLEETVYTDTINVKADSLIEVYGLLFQGTAGIYGISFLADDNLDYLGPTDSW